MNGFLLRHSLIGAVFAITIVASPALANHAGGNAAANPAAAHPIAVPLGRPAVPGDTDRGNSANTITAKPATHGDTDRGRSEGMGHNDRMHSNNRARRGTLVSLAGNVAVVRLANGSTRTVTVANPGAFAPFVAKPVNFKTNANGTITLIGR